MEKRTITFLIVAISVALLGLVLIQAKWVRDTLVLKDAQFSESIDNALVAVSDRLERAEARQTLSHIPNGERGTALFFEERVPMGDTVAVQGQLSDDTLDELLRGILTTGMFRDIRERIDPRLLDSLITEELKLRHIHCNHEYGVFGDNGETILLNLYDAGDSLLVRNSTHRTQLFRNDWPREQGAGPAWWLHLNVPARPSLLLRSMWPMVATSSLFLLLIAAIFGYTLRTILRQKRLGDIKNDLVNNLTHELKTPISTISLACEALNDPGIPKDPEQIRMFTGMIRDENKRLGMLVESVLLSAVTDQGGMRLRLTDVDMHALLAEVVRNSALQAEKRGGRISFKPEAELAHVRGDRTYLTSIFYNLIDNAVKYCTVSPVIQITTRSDAQFLTIEVRDNGIGIPKQEQGKVFDRLYRVPTGNVHNVKGFGLGLSYVKSVVERHGGAIRVESNLEGYDQHPGSRFIITIPFEHGEEDKTAALRG
ncbi:MAG: HAMP domain-containing histidine kinase [Flavobacteriales bacterium]|nr:HAMP domain-containing histidine kinase [Flavobacteriales bacterium]